jgi:2-polyprenyl-3-methyl-5-hydroxy-6-metoxy-1,4-benzoquinol methylase
MIIAGKLNPLDANLRYYGAHARRYIKETRNLNLSELQSVFMSNLPESAHILDAGCGSGRDSVVFHKHGFDVTAIDASPQMVRATRKLGIDARLMTFQEMTYDKEFDGIWACASLLHVPKAEIRDVIERLGKALRPGGILLATLKEGTGERITEDGRFFAYYSLKEVSQLIKRAKCLSVLDARRTTDDSVRPWLNIIAQRKSARIPATILRRSNEKRSLVGFAR